MNPWIQEVIDAHVIIEQWLGRKEGSAQALMSRFFHKSLQWFLSAALRWITRR